VTRPSLRDRLKPAELVGLSAVVAAFVGLVTLIATRIPELALIFTGIAFILALLLLAMLALVASEPPKEQDGPVLLPKPKDRPRD
jgi:hypothetical protein